MGGFGGRVEYVDYRVQCRMLEQPAFRRLSCWQARASELCEGVAWIFAPGPRAQRLGCPAWGLVTHFLFCSIHLQSVSQRFTEVTGDERVWVLSRT